MSQQPHFTATATPTDISAGREAGCYLAQPTEGDVLYATANVAPTDPDDYFLAEAGQSFTFWAGDDLPTWVRMGTDFVEFPVFGNPSLAVAVARLT